jgi:hypothetical protein
MAECLADVWTGGFLWMNYWVGGCEWTNVVCICVVILYELCAQILIIETRLVGIVCFYAPSGISKQSESAVHAIILWPRGLFRRKKIRLELGECALDLERQGVPMPRIVLLDQSVRFIPPILPHNRPIDALPM